MWILLLCFTYYSVQLQFHDEAECKAAMAALHNSNAVMACVWSRE